MVKQKIRIKLSKRQAIALWELIGDELEYGETAYGSYDHETTRKLLSGVSRKIYKAFRKIGSESVLPD